MTTTTVFAALLRSFVAHHRLFDDKLEEIPERTQRALWFLVWGERRAVERCDGGLLPPLSGAQLIRLEALIQQRIDGVLSRISSSGDLLIQP